MTIPTQICCRCHNAPAKPKDCYCVGCRRTYNREWTYRKRGSKPRPVKPVLQPGEKFCFKCERILPVARFSRCKSKRDGLMSHCKDCDYLRQMAYKSKHRARIRVQAREGSRRFRAAHPGYNAAACLRYKRRRIARKMQEAVQSPSCEVQRDFY